MSSSLDGRSVVITRSITQNESLRRLLEARGADVVEVPLIAIAEPDDEGRERDEVLQRFHEFDWIVVTSPNGAERVAPFISAAEAVYWVIRLFAFGLKVPVPFDQVPLEVELVPVNSAVGLVAQIVWLIPAFTVGGLLIVTGTLMYFGPQVV
jgi:hypothetical protein